MSSHKGTTSFTISRRYAGDVGGAVIRSPQAFVAEIDVIFISHGDGHIVPEVNQPVVTRIQRLAVRRIKGPLLFGGLAPQMTIGVFGELRDRREVIALAAKLDCARREKRNVLLCSRGFLNASGFDFGIVRRNVGLPERESIDSKLRLHGASMRTCQQSALYGKVQTFDLGLEFVAALVFRARTLVAGVLLEMQRG